MFHCTIDHIPHVYCNTSTDCDQAPYGTCDTSHHTCIAGDGGTQLDGDMTMHAGPDMFCGSSAECSDEAPICSVQRCRACADSSDDPQCVAHNPATPRCNSPTGTCVACLTSTDCANPTPVCNTTAFTCRKCAAHSECSSGVCKDDGTCAAATDIAYVNNSSGACADTMHTSTPMMPYCQVQYAVLNASKAYVLVSGSATAYNSVSLIASTSALGPLTLVGPAGRGTAVKATISSTIATAALVVNGGGSSVTLIVDGMDIEGAGGATPSAAVSCQSPATLTIKNSTIQNSGKEGVTSAGCTLTLDANVVSANGNEGIKLASTTYVITNNIIHHNGGNAPGLPGVTISDSASTGTFAFNTVAANGGANTVEGGISCPNTGAAKLIQDSIVALNSHNPAANGTQIVGKCQLQSVVTGPDSFTGATQSAPAFTADYHLDVTATGLTANQACCIDKVASAATPNANHDVDEGPRPKVVGTALDIGAHEAQ
jgi:parallel beta helix pectate lyase-like protein